MLGQLLDALERDLHAPSALERERLGDHGHGQDAHFLGQLRDHRRRAGAGTATHAAGDEDHVGTVQQFADALAILERGLATDLGIGPGAESLGDVRAELQGVLGPAVLERLRIGVGTDEIHALDLGVTMWLTALPPPPPTPMTLITAFGSIHRPSQTCSHPPSA